MNSTTVPPPPQAAQPPRSSFSCDSHPEEKFNGFCPLCLCERLHTLDQNAAAAVASSSSRRPSTSSSTAAAAIKAIFKVPSSLTTNNNTEASKAKTKPSFFSELRRTQSFSASKNEVFSGVFEPQRHSCDVRGRNTLWTLFSLDDDNKNGSVLNQIAVSGSVSGTVPEDKEVEDEVDEICEIRASEEIPPNVTTSNTEIRVSEETYIEGLSGKTIKDHIDLNSQRKKPSAGMNFWSAASGFSKKWQKWMRKHKKPSRNGGSNLAALPVEKPISRQFRETQSEIADYGFGRRSCDTDPRFSLDAGRISFDDPRYSFDEPRASWDGYLIGRNFPRLPPMVEDDPIVHIPRTDTQIPVVDDTLSINGSNAEDENVPGGSVQTREYYLDSSSKRRKSFDRSSSARKSLDRSSSARKSATSLVSEINDIKAVLNTKVPPATIDYVNGGKVMNGDRDLRDFNSNSNSLRDDCSETFEPAHRDNAAAIGNKGEGKWSKKSRRWSWNLWGFIHRRGTGNKDDNEERGTGNKDDNEERYNHRRNGIERSLSGSWQDLTAEGNREARGGLNRKVFRSNSSVSWRNSNNMGGSFGSTRKSNGFEMNGNGKTKKKNDEFVLERNRSVRYSPPSHIDNGLLRVYLTPLRNNRRGKLGKSRSNNSHSIARSILGL